MAGAGLGHRPPDQRVGMGGAWSELNDAVRNNYEGGCDDIGEVERILREGGDAILAEKNSYKQIPLHAALEYKCTARVALLLARKTHARRPALLTEGDKDGWTALHFAMWKQHPEEVVTCLLQLSPKAASVENKDRKLPLYFGLEQNAPPPALMAVLLVHPAAARNKKILEERRSKLVNLVICRRY